MSLTDIFSTALLDKLDADAVKAYNKRIETRGEKVRNRFSLQYELGPCGFEGDIEHAKVVLLLANPGFDDTSGPEDHLFSRAGWPLSGLHDDAPIGVKGWWQPRLRMLIEAVGRRIQVPECEARQHVAKTVGSLQLTPWASNRFDDGLRLPSRGRMLQAASSCANRGAILVLMRSRRLWTEATAVKQSPNLIQVRNPRCSYLSPGNLPEGAWARIVDAVCS